MSDETNREAAEQPNAEVESNANPEIGSGRIEQSEAEVEQRTESTDLTPEEIENLKQFQNQLREANITDPKAFYADYTRKSQRAAQADQLREANITDPKAFYADYTKKSQRAAQADQLEQWRTQVESALLQQQQARTDPVEAARQRWLESRWTDDEPAAQEAYLEAREQRAIQRAAMQAMQGMEFRTAIDQASPIGGLKDPNELARRESSMTIQDRVLAQNLLEAHKAGTLPDFYKVSEEKRRNEELRRKRLDDLAGDGSPGRVPGADRSTDRTIDPGEFYAMAPAARKRKYGSDNLDDLIRR